MGKGWRQKQSREREREKEKMSHLYTSWYLTGVLRCLHWITANNTACEGVSVFLTLSDEHAVTLEAAMMKSRISMVAPGRPILKNLGLQCFIMVFTMSCRNNTVLFFKHTLIAIAVTARAHLQKAHKQSFNLKEYKLQLVIYCKTVINRVFTCLQNVY